MAEVTAAHVMCVLCKQTGDVETDVDKAEGVATALAWALHFVEVHPDAPPPGSRYLVILRAEPGCSES